VSVTAAWLTVGEVGHLNIIALFLIKGYRDYYQEKMVA
jgi:hypothetical protein